MNIYTYKKVGKTTKIKFLGITLFKEDLIENRLKSKYLYGLFKKVKIGYCSKYYFLGIKFYQKYDKISMIEGKMNHLQKMNSLYFNVLRASNMVAVQHQKVFPKFENIHKGKEAVLIGTGPTMLYYRSIKDAVHIGVNTSYQSDKFNLDYLFSLDCNPIRKYLDDIKDKEFTKFFGQNISFFPHIYYTDGCHIPTSWIKECKNANLYYFEQGNFSSMAVDITTQVLPDLCSGIFSAAYFTLFTGVKKMYIVGCDCSANGHFNADKQIITPFMGMLPAGWKKIKDYAQAFYPDTEIISINPIGLRGLFRDVYTQSYLDANPQLKEELGISAEILDEEIMEIQI